MAEIKLKIDKENPDYDLISKLGKVLRELGFDKPIVENGVLHYSRPIQVGL